MMAMAMMITQRWWRCDGQKRRFSFSLSLSHKTKGDCSEAFYYSLPPKLRSIFQFLTLHVVPLTMTSCFIILVNQTIDNGRKRENMSWVYYTVSYLNLQMNLLLYSRLSLICLTFTRWNNNCISDCMICQYNTNICSYYTHIYVCYCY